MSSQVHLVGSRTLLLEFPKKNNTQDGFFDCHFGLSDEVCNSGVVGVNAFARYYSGAEPFLVVPWADTTSSLVTLNLFGMGLNLVSHFQFNYSFFLAPPSLVNLGRGFEDDFATGVFDLQYTEFPLLLTNVLVPLSNTWKPYMTNVHLDKATRIAVLHISNEDPNIGTSQVDAAVDMLYFVEKANADNYCGNIESSPVRPSLSTYMKELYYNLTYTGGDCYAPVIFYEDLREPFEKFLPSMLNATFPPALIIDVNGNAPEYSTPMLLGSTWVVSYVLGSDFYHHQRLTIAFNSSRIDNVELLTFNSTDLPLDAKDTEFVNDLIYFWAFVSEGAASEDPVAGSTGDMPGAIEQGYYRCMAGECEIGNLFTDALRWQAEADVAFLPAVQFQGSGWPAGPVRVSTLWDALPFGNTRCTGVMTGLSLFRLLDYSIGQATFQGVQTVTGGRLLQVSGMRIEYNSKLDGNRILAIDVWNETLSTFQPLERLRLYSFATDSFVCSTYDPFPSYVGEKLVLTGEEPASEVSWLSDQWIVRDYLDFLDVPYATDIQGRLVNNTGNFSLLDFVQTRDDCLAETQFWSESLLSCLPCPNFAGVSLSTAVEYSGTSGSVKKIPGSFVIRNVEEFAVVARPKLATLPPWISFASPDGFENAIAAGTNLTVDIYADPAGLRPGTAESNVVVQIKDGGTHPGCASRDFGVLIFATILPPPGKIYLGAVSAFGFTVAAVILVMALFFASWIMWNRKLRVVLTMQPLFLLAICFGVLVMGLSVIPFSIDDGIASQRGADMACMSFPWLLTMGFIITTAALFSKLWRINRLFGQHQFRRVQVKEKDVLLPFLVLFVLNLVFLLVWTLVNPLTYKRFPVPNQPTTTYGQCVIGGNVGIAMVSLVAVVNFVALVLACQQAFKARNISSEFSESKYLGIAIFSWVQLLIVGLPVYFLINEDNPTAKYSLLVALIFAVCLSMLLVIFAPIMIEKYTHRVSGGSRVRISGLTDTTPVIKITTTSRNSHNSPGGGVGSHSAAVEGDSDRAANRQERSVVATVAVEDIKESDFSILPGMDTHDSKETDQPELLVPLSGDVETPRVDEAGPVSPLSDELEPPSESVENGAVESQSFEDTARIEL